MRRYWPNEEDKAKILKNINGLIITPLVYSGLVAKAIVDGPETPCIRR